MTEEVRAKAKAVVYFQHKGSWIPSQDGGLSDVVLYKNAANGSWRVKSTSVLNPNYMAINSEMVGGIAYQRTKAQFHQWTWHGGETYGLGFQNPEEANEFGSAVEDTISSINAGTKEMNTRLILPTELRGREFQCLSGGTFISEELDLTWALILETWLLGGSLPNTVFYSAGYSERVLNLHSEVGSIVYYNAFMNATERLEDAEFVARDRRHNTLLVISIRSKFLNGVTNLSKSPYAGEEGVLISATAGFRILAPPRKFNGQGPWQNIVNMELVVDPFSDSLICANCKPEKGTRKPADLEVQRRRHRPQDLNDLGNAAWQNDLATLQSQYAAAILSRSENSVYVGRVAAGAGRVRVLQWLESIGKLDDEATDNDGRNLALHAAFYGHWKVLWWLESVGKLNDMATDNSGRNLAHTAAFFGHLKVLRWLEKKGKLRVEARDKLGRNLAHYSAFYGHLKILRWLESIGKLSDKARDNLGWKLAHHAAWEGHLKVLRWLRSVDMLEVEAKDNAGRIIELIAAQRGKVDVVEWLRSVKDVAI